MVYVTLSETYDLSTKPSKMSLIGVHTPNSDIIKKTYPGLCMNAKFMRVVSQSVAIACASVLPADPSQVGTETGKISPQDLFNPILYKAVSNESMSVVESRLWGLRGTYNPASAPAVTGAQAEVENEYVTGQTDDFGVYYSLLSNHDGWKKAHPQQGLEMTNLVPLVFEKYYNAGVNTNLSSDYVPALTHVAGQSGLSEVRSSVGSMRGRAHPMPRVNTTYFVSATWSGESAGMVTNGMWDGRPGNAESMTPVLPPVYTACIIMPPSANNKMYYRMTVRTVIEFTEIRPITEITSFSEMNSIVAPLVYHSDYNEQSKSMSKTLGLVDAADADLEKIMDGA